MIGRNKLSSCEKIWRNHICILLSDRSQSENVTYSMIPTIWHFGKGNTIKTAKKKNQLLPGVWGKGRIGRAPKIFKANCFVKYCNGRYMTPYICQNPQSCSKVSPNVNYSLRLIIMYQY